MNEVIAPSLSERGGGGQRYTGGICTSISEDGTMRYGTVRVVASVKGTRTTAFEIASTRCRNFVIIPAVVVLLAVGLYVHRFDSIRPKRVSESVGK